MRTKLTLTVAGLACIAILATGCGKSDNKATPSPTPTPATPSASATPETPKPSIPVSKDLKGIDAVGKFGEAPTINGTWPWAIESTQVKVLSPGNGPKVASDGEIEVMYQGLNARSGQIFDESFSKKAAVAFPLNGVIQGFKKGLENQQVGSRVLIAMPGSDGYDASGGRAPSIEVGDTLIFVVDIVATKVAKPEGAKVEPKPGLPTVSASEDHPTITVPADYQAPAELVVQPLITGNQRVVAATDKVTIAYAMYSAKTGKLIQETYGKTPPAGALSGLIPAWTKAIAGQPIGSRLLIVSPPAEAYPDGNEKPKIEKGEPLVFVVDILFAQAGGQG